ncbi:ComF family protein [Candidatus Nomurabacteria bacterium]|nr:ComF family protein [Candidatus Nomurabacteria bacterium]
MEKTIFTIKSGFNFLLEILFPSKCIGCHKSGEILCQNCIDGIRLAERPTEDKILALYDYRDPIIKNAIWKLKYYRSPYLGRKLGELLFNSFLEEIELLRMFSLGSPILVIPVPISHDKRKLRGYNQSEIIAKSFCSFGYSNLFKFGKNIIYKKSNTIPQARIENRVRRLKNVKDAFLIRNKEIVKGRTVIIIDDVTTTGGTLTEIIKLLKKSGSKKVVAFAVAH